MYCNQFFDVLVAKGTIVSANEAQTKKYYPIMDNQSAICISIYTSGLQCPTYTDEKESNKIGSFSVELDPCEPSDPAGRTRWVEVAMSFAGTRVTVTGTTQSGRKVDATCDTGGRAVPMRH